MAFAAPLKSQGLESIFKNQFIIINLPESSHFIPELSGGGGTVGLWEPCPGHSESSLLSIEQAGVGCGVQWQSQKITKASKTVLQDFQPIPHTW